MSPTPRRLPARPAPRTLVLHAAAIVLTLAVAVAGFGGGTGCGNGCPAGRERVCEVSTKQCACAEPCSAEGACPAGTQCLPTQDDEALCVPPQLYSIDCLGDTGTYVCFQSFCGYQGTCEAFCDTSADCESGCCVEEAQGVPGRAIVVRVCREPGADACLP
jgi:hypothetical protein